MKKVKIFAGILAVVLFASCDDFLSEVPDDRTQLDSAEKISELLVNAYPTYAYQEFLEIMSDNAFDSGAATSESRNNTQDYNWIMRESVTQDSQSAYWDGAYKAIAHANQAIEAIDKMGNPSNLSNLRGEALIARAYAHFMLSVIWSKPYNPQTAESDLGIPYVTKPETELIKQYDRGNLADVYANIEKDIIEGLPLVTDKYRQPKFHFNVDAAHAFATKFFIAKGDWENALKYSNRLGSKPNSIRDYVAFNKLSIGQRELNYTLAEHTTNLLVSTVVSNYWRTIANANRFQLTSVAKDAIFVARLNPLVAKPFTYSGGSYSNGRTFIYPKYREYFKVENANAGTGLPFVNYVLFSNDEMYLNRIEAMVMLGQIDAAIVEFDYFLSRVTTGYDPATDKLTLARIKATYPAIAGEYTPFYSMTDDQTSFVKAIAEAKRRDLIGEGNRWFDIKRFHLVVNHPTDGVPNTLTKDDNRRQMQLPLHVVSMGLTDNPR